jgi:gamma-glutamyltranspeptidase/glutathione hydrolase
MPMRGWDSVTVPGAVSVWAELSGRFGRLPFEDLFEPAIHYAADGFPVSPKTASAWGTAPEDYKDFPDFGKTFLPDGRPPETGEIFKCPDQAKTLEEIANTSGESFYRGKLAERIADCSRHQGGSLSFEDLAMHKTEWAKPLFQEYREFVLHELPPNGQGIAALIVLGILKHFDLKKYPVDSADSIHLQIEAMKLGFADVKRHLADPEYMSVDISALLDGDYLTSRAKLIDIRKARFPIRGIPHDRGTVYLTAADSDGLMVSLIQSNFWGFGSGIVIPDTGISMQNRGYGFTLEREHPNRVDGGKRPYHTIIPGFVTGDGLPVMSFGVMGGHMQPQGHVQMMTRIIDYRQNPQTASDAPRWCLLEDMRVAVEPGFSTEVLKELSDRGHDIVTDLPEFTFGGAQLICRMDDHYIAASDHRKDGMAIGF